MESESGAVPAVVPLFPLPEITLLPRQLLPLHVFEPRYCQMVADALAGDRFIAVVMLRPGFERTYFTRHAPIHDVVGVGRIVSWEELEEGRYNILLRGEARARICGELNGKPYRLARIEVLHSTHRPPRPLRAALRQTLHQAIRENIRDETLRRQYLKLLRMPLPLGDLADLLAGSLPLPAELRQALLAEKEDSARLSMILDHLRTLGALHRRGDVLSSLHQPSPN